MIVAFDLATQTGVAAGEPGGVPRCWTERLGDKGAPHGARMAQTLRMTNRVIKEYSPDLIVLERPVATGGGHRTRPEMLFGARGCVLGIAYMLGIPVEEHDVRTIRKHFIGTAKLAREAAKLATIKRCGQLGYRVANDDEADAAAMWDLACARRSRAHGLMTTELFRHG